MAKVEELNARLQSVEGERKVDVLTELCKAYWYNDLDKAMMYGRDALQLALDIDYQKGRGDALKGIGAVYRFRGDFDQALTYYLRGLDVYESIDEKEGIAASLNNIAVIYRMQGNETSSLEYHLKALKIREEINHRAGIAASLNNIAGIYFQQNDYELSLEYYFKSLKIREEIDDLWGIAAAYSNIGGIYEEQGDIERGLEYKLKSLEIRRQINDLMGVITSLNNIGRTYGITKQYDLALKYSFEALSICEEIGENDAIISSHIGIAAVYEARGEFDLAEEYSLNAKKLAEKIGAKDMLRQVYYSLSKIYYGQGRHDESYEYMEQYVQLMTEVFNEEKSRQIAEMQTKYETEKKEREAEIYRLKNVELVEKNEVILKQKEEIEIQREELRMQNEQLIETLDELQRMQRQLVEAEKMAALANLVGGVAHEINTPVGVSLTAISTLIGRNQQFNKIYQKDELTQEDLEEHLQLVNEVGELIQENMKWTGELVQNFKQVAVDQSTEKKRSFRVKQYFMDVITGLQPHLKDKSIKIHIDCDDDLQITSFPGDFAQILTHLIINSYLHGFVEQKHGSINITVQHDQHELHLSYQDDGKGIDAEILPRIFDPFVTTNKQKGSGLGLHIVYNLITQKLKGTVTCQSQENEGVVFDIRIKSQSSLSI